MTALNSTNRLRSQQSTTRRIARRAEVNSLRKKACPARHRFDSLLRSRGPRRGDARNGPSEWPALRLFEPGEPGAAGAPVASDPAAGERGVGAVVTGVCGDLRRLRAAVDPSGEAP